MKIHTTNYENTFIQVADDSPALKGEVPPLKRDKKSVAHMQYELLHRHPYEYTSDDALFAVYAQRNDLTRSEWKAAREAFFSKGQPCFRASPLTKRYGWGLHCDADGKIALIGSETDAYRTFSDDKNLTIVKAMRSAK